MADMEDFVEEKRVGKYEEIKNSYLKKGFNLVDLNLALLDSKKELLDECSRQLSFPNNPTNWDAFEDWITDLSWLTAKNTLVMLKNLREHTNENTKMLLDILKKAKEFHSKHGVKFDVMVFEEK